MITAAEAITQLHSRGVLHGDIREPNIILLNNPHDPFPIQFVDFGSSLPIEGIREDVVKNDFRAETERWMVLLLGYFGLDAMEGFPALRTIPREGAIMKFIETWDIRPTREEQVEAMVAKRMAKGHCNEATIREILLECYM
ncbi:hypothetical protein BDV93DRAFT_337509 [Ceratobasidium sp. AG-I]|nr:hypothetical protein BDV93DRAFT_337509 [Ceratobasidium sp. AG-I]